jgi:hypothetical protein
MVQYDQQFVVRRDVAHRMAIVHVAGLSLFVNDHLGRHAPQFEELDLLSVAFEHGVFWIGQSNEIQLLLLPIISKCFCVLGTHHDDLGVPIGKLGKISAQLRHMPAAEGSPEATIEDQDDVLVALIVGQAHGLVFKILQGKVWCCCVDLNLFCHLFSICEMQSVKVETAIYYHIVYILSSIYLEQIQNHTAILKRSVAGRKLLPATRSRHRSGWQARWISFVASRPPC